MKLQKSYLVASCLLLVFTMPLFAQTAYLRTTTDANRWVDGGTIAGTAYTTTANYIETFPGTEYQTVIAWGGTIQERHWVTMQSLSAAGKDSIMRALFDTSGCNIGFCRLSIGCSDFDLNEQPISLNETSGDYAMNNFSVHRDSLRKIPLIKMAQAIHPGLRFWASPWSPPYWMHDNGNYQSGNMKSDAQTLTAYALYLSKYVQAYRTAGINVEMICCQNEPTINDGGYPKCGWANSLELNFYKNYMIPRFNTDGLTTRIILGVFCCGNYADWITYLMNDATIRGFVNATSHSYQSPDWGTQSVAAYPTIPFFESEAPFGPWPTPTDPLELQNWARGVDLFNNVSDFMNARTSVYTIWNMVNDETGKSGFNWMQTIAIRVNSSTKVVTYLPWFYAYKHFSHYVKPGAKAVRYTTNGASPAKTVAFKNPNGDIILVLSNTSASTYALTAKVGAMMWKATLPANSFNTLRIATGGIPAVKERKLENTAMPALNNVRILNSTLYFSLSADVNAREAELILKDLQGRTVWTGHFDGSALQGGQQSFAIQSERGNLSSGTYLLAARIKNSAGTVTTVEKKVLTMN